MYKKAILFGKNFRLPVQLEIIERKTRRFHPWAVFLAVFNKKKDHPPIQMTTMPEYQFVDTC